MSVERTSDEVYFDFESEADGAITRPQHVIRRCPKCQKLGERRARRSGRRYITHVHKARALRHPDGAFGAMQLLRACRYWEKNDDGQRDFSGWIEGKYPRDDGGAQSNDAEEG